jgi:hypothetical protein
MEHLVLKGTAIRHQMKKAEKKFKELFISPVREWLREQPDNRAEVLGVARPLLRIVLPKAAVNEQAVLEELRKLVAAGKFTAMELGQMVLDGSFDFGDPDLAAKHVADKLGVDPSVFTVMKVTKREDSVQWDTVKKKDVEVITNEFKRLHDLEGVVAGAATRGLPADVINNIKGVTS